VTAQGDLDRAKIGELYAQELARFRAHRPRSLAMISRARAHMPNGVPMAWMASEYDQPVYIDRGQGPGFTDVDGFSYVDFNASDMTMFCGHANVERHGTVSPPRARRPRPAEAALTR
jgi:glutamate-1-semialdehyde 2,1-aminomutase